MSEAMITIRSFSKSFGSLKVITDLNFEVKQGEIFAFLGANGSGKTTTIRNLLGIQQPDSGELLIKGKRYSTDDSYILGYLPEERGLYLQAKALETLAYFGQLKGLSSTEATQNALDYLERVELADKKDIEVKKLSSGQQQKIQLGITLMGNPELLILDEPWKGLDPVNRSLLAETLAEMNAKGTTIMFCTHQMDDAERIASRLLLLKNGKAKLYGGMNEIKRQFGENTIHLRFDGSVPAHTDLYDAKVDTNSAEIVPKSGVTPDEVLRFLVGQDIEIAKFELTSPSLQEIFIRASQDEE